MSLYEKCLSLANNLPIPECTQNYDGISALVPLNSSEVHLTGPSFIRQEIIPNRQRTVYYISDLHLDHHIIRQFPYGADDGQITTYIQSVALDLFNGEFGDNVRAFESPIVLFGGDISSSFSIDMLFYKSFLTIWEQVVDERYYFCHNEIASINDELLKKREELQNWKERHPWVNKAQNPLADYSDLKVPRKIKDIFAQINTLEEQAEEKRKELGLTSFWESDYKSSRRHAYIYAILGNHELWDFESFDACESRYRELFHQLGINFLCDDFQSIVFNPTTKKMERLSIRREDNPVEFDNQMLYLENILIVGGLGFAGNNSAFNANQGIYGLAVNRDEELARCSKWRELFQKACVAAKKVHCTLVVLSHNPITDWGVRLEECSNCVFLSGHTHRNIAYGENHNNFIFADNQVGYNGERFQFKKAVLHPPRNPFAADPDGFREITCEELKEYYRFVRETIPGTGTIERQTNKCNAKLYVMKQDGYVGFFLTSPRGVYICNGGQVRKIGSIEPLDRYYENFKIVIEKYIVDLSPLRRAQEQLSSFVKSFGGTGTIHGTIVDIDFFNHIMLNTNDGTVTFYHSPKFGIVKTYSDIGNLLHTHCPVLEERFHEIGNGQLTTATACLSEHESEYECVDIKNSPYALSRRINALQRLFDKRILRDWNPSIEEI